MKTAEDFDLDDDPIDDLIRAYYELQGGALQLFESEGRAYAERCEACGEKDRTMDRMGNQVCANHRCGALWPYVVKMISHGEVQKSGRPQGYENRLAGLVPVGYALNQMLRDRERWRWAAQVLVGYAITANGYDDIAEHANRFGWPHPQGGAWTDKRCRAAASAARRELRKRMKRERHLSGPGATP